VGESFRVKVARRRVFMLTLFLPPFLSSLPFRLQQCYVSLVENLNVTDTYCLKYALSKGLGLGMVAGGAILKVPQIISVVSSGSAKGLSLSSYVLDTAATAITVAYNIRKENPFSTYGELGFLLVQNVRSQFPSSS
jgi:mannose-P-dolichol utilization defect protein 1